MRRKRGTSMRDEADDPLEEQLIAFAQVTDFNEIYAIIRNGLDCSLSSVTQTLVYVLDPWTDVLVSYDGLGGATHTLPTHGLAGKLREERTRIIESRGLDAEDPLWGLLPSGRGVLPHNRAVVCSPVLEFGTDRLLGVLVVACDVLSADDEKRLNLLERHISACLSRMQRTNSCPSSGKDDLEDMSKYNDSILELCADLHDHDSISLQLKVIKYLERQTQSEFCTLLVVSEDSSELFTQVIGKRVLKDEVKFIIPLTYFNSVVVEKKVLTQQDISEEEKKTLSEKLEVTLNNFICVPVINNATSKVVAVACAINKLRGSSFSAVDIKVIRHCFRYTVPVLTSTLALQTERELKQDTQSMLQVAKNLFTHLGRFQADVVSWSQCPLELQSLHANINLLAQFPKSTLACLSVCSSSTDVDRSPGRNFSSDARINLPPFKEEQSMDFLAQERIACQIRQEREREDGNAATGSSSREEQPAFTFSSAAVPQSSPLWQEMEKDTLAALSQLNQLSFDPMPVNNQSRESSSSSNSAYSDANSSSQAPSGDSNASASDQQRFLSLEDDAPPQTSEGVGGIASAQAVTKVGLSPLPLESQSDTDVIMDGPFWRNLASILVDDTNSQQAWHSISNKDSSPNTCQAKGTQVTRANVGSAACQSLLQKKNSILQLDWSAATLSVHCIEQATDTTSLSQTYDVSDLLREIMQEARNLTHAERCSLFLVESDELVAKVFDGHISGDASEVRIPITQGIAGHVATTGEILNITDVYSHPLFYRGVDDSTGFRTRSILCFPIRDGSKVVGIAELCNKVNGLHFTKHDEDVAAAFSIYCGISIVHGLLYKKMTDAQYRSALANELMMYHMKILEDDMIPFEKQKIPKPTHFHPQVAELSYSPRGIPDADTILAVLSMFDDMGMINRWRIDKPTLARFTMLVKRGYRDTPYHNWSHALTVGHFCYLLYKNFNNLEYLEEIEVFALFVACLCHDLDHRGTNNSFQVHSKSVLAALYSSEGSVMERHHFAQAMCILNTEGCNIFENLSRKDYQNVLDLMQDIILATDLAHHLRIINELKQMASDGYVKSNPRHRQLLMCLLMTSSDLSDQTKNWMTTKKIAELIYREFFTQGDLEKAMGLETPEMFDREKAFIPELQINFLEHIAQPVFLILHDIFPKARPLVEAVQCNKSMWTKLKSESLERRLSSTNSLDFFHVRFTAEPSQERLSEESDTDSNQNRNG
ncbi:cGMP-dependent 3',5'-cyclic phosphodiesterase-like isoform X2 [Apostichopus japonicus]